VIIVRLIMEIDPGKLKYRDAHELTVGTVLPRPIAFVSTFGEDGVFNVAPFSFFTPISYKPMHVGFSIVRKRYGQKKDTLANIEFSREFVINIVTESLAEAMNQASMSYPGSVDEFREVGLTPVKASLVKPPMVAESPINLECRLVQMLEFGEASRRTSFIIGEVVRVHVRDEYWLDGEIRIEELKVIGRLGADFYCRTTDRFEMKRPD
jgi:flavin reductase (DIM6/NTAB) family NADH-FMN oxidoreductase RutF